jgi:hypothetical protein
MSVKLQESDRAVVRSCLDQIVIGMTEARQVVPWWDTLSETRKSEWKLFAASVTAYHRSLEGAVRPPTEAEKIELAS